MSCQPKLIVDELATMSSVSIRHVLNTMVRMLYSKYNNFDDFNKIMNIIQKKIN